MYKNSRKPELLKIKDWCIRYGIKIKDPRGFKGRRNNIYNRLYTRRQFGEGVKRSYIVVKSEKGLDFLESI